MTTIVTFRGWMAADSRFTADTILTDECKKIITRPDGIVVAGAGEGAPGWAVMNKPLLAKNWTTEGGPEFPEEWAEDKRMLKKTITLLYWPGEKFIYQTSDTRWCDPLPVDGCYGIGSGGEIARMACKVLAGETRYPARTIVKKAVEYAIQMDPNSGGKVQVVKLPR